MISLSVTWALQIEKILPPILRAQSFKPPLTGGSDFLVEESSNAFIERIVSSSPGHWKEFPTLGVNIWKYLQSTDSPQVLKREIIEHCRKDVFPNPFVDISNFPTVIVENVIYNQEPPTS